MFNALRSDELLRGVGAILRLVAGKDGPLEEYERSQVLSAYSVTRLLAAEQAAAPALLNRTRQELLSVLDWNGRPAPGTEGAWAAIQAAQGAPELGQAVADLLTALPRDSPLRPGVQAALADMVDREVAALAAAPR